jgi:hypothetical protein
MFRVRASMTSKSSGVSSSPCLAARKAARAAEPGWDDGSDDEDDDRASGREPLGAGAGIEGVLGANAFSVVDWKEGMAARGGRLLFPVRGRRARLELVGRAGIEGDGLMAAREPGMVGDSIASSGLKA